MSYGEFQSECSARDTQIPIPFESRGLDPGIPIRPHRPQHDLQSGYLWIHRSSATALGRL